MFKDFKSEIFKAKLNDEQLFQKFFIDSKTFFFNRSTQKQDQEYLLKKDMAEVLDIHIHDIYVVGSAKTGFSMKPKCTGMAFDEKHANTSLRRDLSDIDIAIVSEPLFDHLQENVYDHTLGFSKNWNKNSFYKENSFKVSLKYKFLEYLGKGWYRQDLAPPFYQIETDKGKINDIINKWRRELKRKVSFALYKNWNFFKKYQLENISILRAQIEKGDFL